MSDSQSSSRCSRDKVVGVQEIHRYGVGYTSRSNDGFGDAIASFLAFSDPNCMVFSREPAGSMNLFYSCGTCTLYIL